MTKLKRRKQPEDKFEFRLKKLSDSKRGPMFKIDAFYNGELMVDISKTINNTYTMDYLVHWITSFVMNRVSEGKSVSGGTMVFSVK